MRLTVRTSGGLIGLNRLIEIVDDAGTVSEHGSTRPLELSDKEVQQLATAVRQVVAGGWVDRAPAQDAVDGGLSEIEIVADGTRTTLMLPAGSTASDEVWNLLDLVDEVCDIT